VVATARPGEEADFVRGLGAHEVLDYTGDLDSQIRAVSPDGVDVVLHFAGDAAALAGALSEKGRLASTLGYGPDQHPAAVFIMANPTGETLDRLAADVADGKLTVPVARTYPLDEVPTAFDAFTSGTRGKIAVTVD
jgi:NADPH:quinone reductase-like Zn-dependent oxidoreductase